MKGCMEWHEGMYGMTSSDVWSGMKAREVRRDVWSGMK